MIAALARNVKTAFTLRWNPNRDTVVAFGAGILVILLSLALTQFQGGSTAGNLLFVFLRDVVMIGLIGFLLPLYYTFFVKGKGPEALGLTKKHWLVSLTGGLGLALFFLFFFLSEAAQEGQQVFLNPGIIPDIFYLMLVGIFEVVFFYVFLRQQFEEAFGVIPGILLAAAFYSLHHAGFQPEFAKLFFVGILYAAVFRLTLNVLVIYPFFWGVGGCWDVLVQSEAIIGPAIAFVEVRGAMLLALMVAVVLYVFLRRRKASAREQTRPGPGLIETGAPLEVDA